MPLGKDATPEEREAEKKLRCARIQAGAKEYYKNRRLAKEQGIKSKIASDIEWVRKNFGKNTRSPNLYLEALRKYAMSDFAGFLKLQVAYDMRNWQKQDKREVEKDDKQEQITGLLDQLIQDFKAEENEQ